MSAIISKKELCSVLGIAVYKTGRCNYVKLRKEVFTYEFCIAVGIDEDDLKKVRNFNVTQTKRIKEYFKNEFEKYDADNKAKSIRQTK